MTSTSSQGSEPTRRPAWRGAVNEVLYGINLSEGRTSGIPERVALAVLEQRIFTRPIRTYYDAVGAALASAGPVVRDPEHDAVARSFLLAFIRELDERAPWPEPPFQQLHDDGGSTASAAPVIARLDLSQMEVGEYVNRIFTGTTNAAGSVGVLVLRLRTGEQVTLVAPNSMTQRGIDLHSDAEPVSTLRHFTDLTGIRT